MRICVYGAGAVGGTLAVRLAMSGHQVSVVARGAHLDAIRRDGLTVVAGGQATTARLRAVDAPGQLGEQDAVLITLKSTGLDGLPVQLAPLLGAATTVVFAQNGLPWWYGVGQADHVHHLPDLRWMDPEGELATLAPRTLGAVIYLASEVVAPGVVHAGGQCRLIVGEPDDTRSERVKALRTALTMSRVDSPDVDAIRPWIWSKLVMNISNSLLAVVTERTPSAFRSDAALNAIAQRLHGETCALALACSPAFEAPPFGTPKSDHMPSMLQDLVRGRHLEIDALLTAPLAFARAAGVFTPTLDAIGALVADKAERAGLHAAGLPLPIDQD
jgi:2-dehydropantoate 2-reductase